MHTFFCHPVGNGQCQLKMFVFSDKGIYMTLTLSSIVDVPSQPCCCLSSSILSLSMAPHHICIFSAITHASVSNGVILFAHKNPITLHTSTFYDVFSRPDILKLIVGW